MNEVMSIVGEICGENDWAKEARSSLAKTVETLGKERKKVAAVALLVIVRIIFEIHFLKFP